MRKFGLYIAILSCFLFLSGSLRAGETDTLEYRGTVYGGFASRSFNPYMLGSWRHGKTPMGGTAALDLSAEKPLNLSRRFSWTAGAEVMGGYTGKTDYLRYNTDGTAGYHGQGMPAAWLQQLYAGVKYRGVFLTAGLKERGSLLVDNGLSSGDLVAGINARPVAQVRIGFIDFQNIPFTRGWVQIEGNVAYGKMCDASYLRNHYNYYNEHITEGALYTYKRAYFRTNPNKPLSVTVGVQSAGLFGGTTTWYNHGKETASKKNPENLKAFWEMFIPTKDNGDGFVEGSSLGSWDFKARYLISGGHQISGYFQWLWEDGSSMGRRNKWDGLWGIEYLRIPADDEHPAITGAVLEYIDFRDQSGPLHWAPGDAPGTTITTEATGGDDYYNNTGQNSYSHFGMSMGTPFVLSPIYNTNGLLQFRHTRSRGFHAGARGWLTSSLQWRGMVSYAVAWGNGRDYWPTALHNTSAMAECVWDARCILPGLSGSAALAFDAGSLRGNNWGMLFTVSYSGNFAF